MSCGFGDAPRDRNKKGTRRKLGSRRPVRYVYCGKEMSLKKYLNLSRWVAPCPWLQFSALGTHLSLGDQCDSHGRPRKFSNFMAKGLFVCGSLVAASRLIHLLDPTFRRVQLVQASFWFALSERGRTESVCTRRKAMLKQNLEETKSEDRTRRKWSAPGGRLFRRKKGTAKCWKGPDGKRGAMSESVAGSGAGSSFNWIWEPRQPTKAGNFQGRPKPWDLRPERLHYLLHCHAGSHEPWGVLVGPNPQGLLQLPRTILARLGV